MERERKRNERWIVRSLFHAKRFDRQKGFFSLSRNVVHRSLASPATYCYYRLDRVIYCFHLYTPRTKTYTGWSVSDENFARFLPNSKLSRDLRVFRWISYLDRIVLNLTQFSSRIVLIRSRHWITVPDEISVLEVRRRKGRTKQKRRKKKEEEECQVENLWKPTYLFAI